jgi:hypothetical protein
MKVMCNSRVITKTAHDLPGFVDLQVFRQRSKLAALQLDDMYLLGIFFGTTQTLGRNSLTPIYLYLH